MYENENQSFDNREQDYHYTNTPEQQAPTRPRKKNTNAARIAKKAGAIALSAVLFGGVASGTFLGVNYAAGYRNNASTAASSESASASSQTASSSSSLLKATTPVSTGSAASSGSLDVSSVAESVMPSIVSITNKSVQEVQNYFSMFGYGGQAQEVESTSVGSGIIIGKNDTELLIVTNNHVVEGADTLSASFIDNSVYEATIKGDNIPEPGIPESFKVLLKELQSLGLDVKVLKDDNTEVHLLESVDYGDTDLRSVIEGDSRRHHDREEDYGKHGYTKQEFDGEELVDIDEDEDEDDFTELDEALEDNDEE